MTQATARGPRLHWADSGHGEDVVLFLHAFPLHGAMWARESKALERRHRVLVPDYPGLGRSAPRAEASTMESLAEAVLAHLDEAQVKRAAVVGLSMGGYLAFELWRRRPGLIRALALCDTKAGADTPEAAAGRETFAKNAMERGLPWVAGELVPKLLRPSPDPAVVDAVRGLIAGGTPEGVAAAARGLGRRPDSRPTLATITCPTLVVVGALDSLTPPSESQAIAAGVKGARLVEIPGAGHLSNLEAPALFDEALLEFLG